MIKDWIGACTWIFGLLLEIEIEKLESGMGHKIWKMVIGIVVLGYKFKGG